jgi:hypothetical protein
MKTKWNFGKLFYGPLNSYALWKSFLLKPKWVQDRELKGIKGGEMMQHALCNGSWRNSQGNTQDFHWFAKFSKIDGVHELQEKLVNGAIQSFILEENVYIHKATNNNLEASV